MCFRRYTLVLHFAVSCNEAKKTDKEEAMQTVSEGNRERGVRGRERVGEMGRGGG